MRRLTPARRSGGFTVVELLVALGIVALLSAMAVPTLRSVMENSRIKAASQSLQNGLTMARAEAVRLNTRVSFTLAGGGWTIARVDDGAVLGQAAGKESASGVTITPDAAGAIVFDAFGRKSSGPTTVDIKATHPSSSSSHRLRIQLTNGGAVRLCDRDAEPTESKACL